MWRAKLKYICLIVIGLIIIFILKPLLFSNLPHRYNFEVFKNAEKYSEEEMVFKNTVNDEFLVVVPIYGAIAFGSNNNILGIYDNRKILKDEIKLGSIPLRLNYWNNSEIGLWVLNNQNEIDYVKSWIDGRSRLWKYKVKFYLKETGELICNE